MAFDMDRDSAMFKIGAAIQKLEDSGNSEQGTTKRIEALKQCFEVYQTMTAGIKELYAELKDIPEAVKKLTVSGSLIRLDTFRCLFISHPSPDLYLPYVYSSLAS